VGVNDSRSPEMRHWPQFIRQLSTAFSVNFLNSLLQLSGEG
jgi:hypothetical protein